MTTAEIPNQTEAVLRQRLKLARHDRHALSQLVALLSARGEPHQAAKVLTQLCELSPEAPHLWLELAKLWLSAGAPKAAATAARAGLAGGADIYESQCLLAEAHERAGNGVLAIAAYRAGLGARPAASALHNNLGLLLRRRGDLQAALDEFDLAIAQAPNKLSGFNNRGNALRDMGRFEDSLLAYDHALEIAPTHAESLFNRGLVLLQLNRGDQAADEFSRVLASTPGYLEAELQLIEALIASGRFREADEQANRVLARHPDLSRAWYLKALIAPTKADAEKLIHSLKPLCAKRLAAEATSDLDYALGKLFDEIGAYDEAFGHYRRANRHERDKRSKERRGQSAQLIESIRSLPFARWSARAPVNLPVGGVQRQLIFIVGMPRSGTTLVEQILGAHPAIEAAGEVDFFGPALTWAASATYPNVRIETALAEQTEAQKEALRDGYLRRLHTLATHDSLWVTDKTPFNFLYLGLLQQLFPRCRVIHCRRHPLDTCLSIYFQQFGGLDFACDLDEIAAVYLKHEALMQHWESLPNLKLFEVRYESLVANPENEVRALLNFLDLPWDEACRTPHTQTRTINTASRWQARQPIYHHATARWRRYEKYLTALKAKLGACWERY